MARAPSSTANLKLGGLVVGVVGFTVTRFAVLETAAQDAALVEFVVGDALFLAVGLGIAAFGVGLAVSTYSRRYVNAVARWCVLGTVSVALVVGPSYVEASVGMASPPSNGLVSRLLVGGTLAGVALGVRSATTTRQRNALLRQADRITVLNRILRHEVLNKVNVVQGHAASDDPAAADLGTVREHADRIEDAIEEVGFLATATRRDRPALSPVDVGATVDAAVARVAERHPDASFDAGDLPGGVSVRANRQLGTVFEHFLDNAVEHNDADAPRVEVSATVDAETVTVRVADDGPGLPAPQRDLLVSGSLPEYDDPTSGFGLTIAALLLEQYGATVAVDADREGDGGTEIAVTLPRVEEDESIEWDRPYGVDPGTLRDVTVAALVAGVGMGVAFQVLTGSVAVIGALYGVRTTAVGWITHLFHSVVFGVSFVALLAGTRLGGDRESFARCVLLAAGFGVFLWLTAAGVVMPLWLRLVGVPAPVPSLSGTGLAGHLLWGLLLGGVYDRLRRRDS